MIDCKGLAESPCITNNNCSWINGKTRKYCKNKPSNKSKLKTPKVKSQTKSVKSLVAEDFEDFVTPRTAEDVLNDDEDVFYTPKSNNSAEVETAVSQSKTRRKTPTPRKSRRNTPTKSQTSQTSQARKVIGRFLKKKSYKDKIRKNFLTTICSDSGVCMALGKELDIIRKFFNGFTDFKYVVGTKGVGSVSANGFVMKLQYQKDDYLSYAILKSSQKANSDNLVYEYAVGQFINKQCKIFPCFLETYGLYFYENEKTWKEFLDGRDTRSTNTLNEGLKLQNNIDYSLACSQSKYACILIQDIDKPISLRDFLDINYNNSKLMNHIVYILIQVYYPLSMLADKFTHYDLHASNVLIYELPKNQHIEYEFKDFHGNTYSFNTRYIVKIIDYGRSFFDESDTNNSLSIYNQICSSDLCNQGRERCGNLSGFKNLRNVEDLNELRMTNYIDSTKKNVSQDLRLINVIAWKYKENKTTNEIYRIPSKHYKNIPDLENIFYNIKYDGIFGTREVLNSSNTNKITTIMRLYEELLKIMNESSNIYLNTSHFEKSEKIGKLKMDGRNPMIFTV